MRSLGLWVWPGSGLTSGGSKTHASLAAVAASVKGAQAVVSKTPPALALCTAAEQGPREPHAKTPSHWPSPSKMLSA